MKGSKRCVLASVLGLLACACMAAMPVVFGIPCMLAAVGAALAVLNG